MITRNKKRQLQEFSSENPVEYKRLNKRLNKDNDLEIEGTCGGSISCCTCHVIIDKDWYSIVGGPNPDEEDMLDLAVGLQPTSRLGCQIEVSDKLDGLRLLIPEE